MASHRRDRLTGQAPGALGISLSIAVVCVGLMTLLVHRLQEPEPLAALFVTGLAGLLISPVTWTHRWVWVVPLCLLLAHRALQRNGWNARALLAVMLVVFSVDFRLLMPLFWLPGRNRLRRPPTARRQCPPRPTASPRSDTKKTSHLLANNRYRADRGAGHRLLPSPRTHLRQRGGAAWD